MADPAISALNALLRSASIQDHDEALSRADAALKASKPGGPERLTAGHTKVVALLKLDRFDDALRALADEGTALENACVLEKAYALYKTGQLAEAAALCSGGNAARALGHVGAQVAYRAEDFSRAADVYEQLARRVEAEGKPGEEPDMRVNYLATCAQLEWQGRGSRVPEKERQPSRDDMEAFETAYNAACACLGRGDFARAIVLLKRSKDLCEASEDLSNEEKAAEILPIAVQQVYALTQLGKLDEAAALQNSLQLSEYVSLPPGPPCVPCPASFRANNQPLRKDTRRIDQVDHPGQLVSIASGEEPICSTAQRPGPQCARRQRSLVRIPGGNIAAEQLGHRAAVPKVLGLPVQSL